MKLTEKAGQFMAEQGRLIQDFYHLDYWNDHSLSQGFAEAAQEASDRVHEITFGSSRFVQSATGAGMGVAKLFGGLTIGLNDWFIQTANEIPNGPARTFYKFFEVPVRGFWDGANGVSQIFNYWGRGGLADSDSYEIADQVTETLGGAALLVMGTKNILSGAGRFGSGMAKAIPEVQMVPSYGGAAVAVADATLRIDLAGVPEFSKGVMMMAGRKSVAKGTGEDGKSVDTPPPDVMGRQRKFTEARKKAAEALGIPVDRVEIKVNTVWGSLMNDLSDLQIALTVIKHKGNKTRAAEELGVNLHYIVSRFRRAAEGSPLKEPIFEKSFVRNKGGSSNIFPLDMWSWLEFLEKYGYKGRSAISDETLASALDEYVREVKPPTEADLQAFRELTIERGKKHLKSIGREYTESLAPTREWTDRNYEHWREDAKENPIPRTEKLLWKLREEDIRINTWEIGERVYRSDPGSPLAKLKKETLPVWINRYEM